MDEMIIKLTEKISSYNIFNNFLPGIVFCFLFEKTTRFSIPDEDFLEKLFIYYFVGMVASRIGSLIIEKTLSSIKFKKKNCGKESFIVIPVYDDYIIASENQPFIKILRETNNTCRTMVSVFVLLIVSKVYDIFIHDKLISIISKDALIFIGFVLLLLIFIFSYKKQSSYVNERVNNYRKLNNR